MSFKKPLALVEGPNIPVNPTLACHLGYAAAYLLQELHYGLESEATAGYVDAEGLKWIYNSFKTWGERLGIKASLAAQGVRVLLSKKLIYECRPEEKQRRWDQTPHYRINYSVLREFLATIGLKLALDAWREMLGDEQGQSQGSSGAKDEGSKQRLPQRRRSKGRQKQADAAAAFSADAEGNEEARSSSNSLPPAESGLEDQENHSVDDDPAENGDLPPAGAGGRLEAVLEQLSAIKISQKAGLKYIEEFTLDAVEHQLRCLPYRKIKTTAARLLVGSLRGTYDTPKELLAADEQVTAAAEQAETAAQTTAFLEKLVAGITTFISPLGTAYQFVKQASKDTLWVRSEDREDMLPIVVAMKWGIA